MAGKVRKKQILQRNVSDCRIGESVFYVFFTAFTTALYKVVCTGQGFIGRMAGGAALVLVTIACAYVPYRLIECRGTEFFKNRLLQ